MRADSYHTVDKPDLKETDWPMVENIRNLSRDVPGLNERLYLCSVWKKCESERNMPPLTDSEAYGTYT